MSSPELSRRADAHEEDLHAISDTVIEIRDDVAEIKTEHGRLLAEHSTMLSEHGLLQRRMMADHTGDRAAQPGQMRTTRYCY